MEKKELGIAIVKGNVADYAMSVAINNDVDALELAAILREIADLLVPSQT